MPPSSLDQSFENENVGVIGATSFVGEILLAQIIGAGGVPQPFSRRSDSPLTKNPEMKISNWVCVAPIFALPAYFDKIKASGGRRVIALSSTSRYTKAVSADPVEQATALRLQKGEEDFIAWAEANAIEWVIFRPTMIYGKGRDKNISTISNFIRRFGFFPIFGEANGRRQPIHASDVATVCARALQSHTGMNYAYDISGGETLSYLEMVARVFAAMGLKMRILKLPLWAFQFAVSFARLFPKYREASTAMALRMNRDLVFDHSDAADTFGFRPRAFLPSAEDLQKR